MVKCALLFVSWGAAVIAVRVCISRGFPRLQILQAYERSGAESKKEEAIRRKIDQGQVW